MELKIKESINTNSIVLKHKIALEAVTLLSENGDVLITESELYTQLSLVDNFIENNLLDEIEKDDREFAAIIESEIEPKFFEIIEKYDYQAQYEEILDDVLVYMERRNTQINTFVGLINEIYKKVHNNEWDDLKFFFNKIATEVNNALGEKAKEEEEAKKEEEKIIIQKELDGANEKMAALITKFQKESIEKLANNESNE